VLIKKNTQLTLKTMEKLTIKLAIWFLKRAVNEPCDEEDKFVLEDGGCSNCKAWRTINFLEEWITL
jgi:hypothetical protein